MDYPGHPTGAKHKTLFTPGSLTTSDTVKQAMLRIGAGLSATTGLVLVGSALLGGRGGRRPRGMPPPCAAGAE